MNKRIPPFTPKPELDPRDRTNLVADEAGLGLCNITTRCSEVCPEGIHITDNAIIPLKERVVGRR